MEYTGDKSNELSPHCENPQVELERAKSKAKQDDIFKQLMLDSSCEKALIKLQALFRGYMVRKNLQANKYPLKTIIFYLAFKRVINKIILIMKRMKKVLHMLRITNYQMTLYTQVKII